jgi:hypothetical protein
MSNYEVRTRKTDIMQCDIMEEAQKYMNARHDIGV